MIRKVTTQSIEDEFKICFPDKLSNIDLNSSAMVIFTDFKKVKPLMLEGDVPIDDALSLMKRVHIRLKIVIDKNENMIGVISYSDLSGEKPLKIVNGGVSRKEVLVSDVMTPRKELKSLSMADLKSSNIGEIIDLLKHEHTKYIFVVDMEKKIVCGLVSASDIARKLQLLLQIDDGPSFHRIFKVL